MQVCGDVLAQFPRYVPSQDVERHRERAALIRECQLLLRERTFVLAQAKLHRDEAALTRREGDVKAQKAQFVHISAEIDSALADLTAKEVCFLLANGAWTLNGLLMMTLYDE